MARISENKGGGKKTIFTRREKVQDARSVFGAFPWVKIMVFGSSGGGDPSPAAMTRFILLLRIIRRQTVAK